jgi:hypothetical protein
MNVPKWGQLSGPNSVLQWPSTTSMIWRTKRRVDAPCNSKGALDPSTNRVSSKAFGSPGIWISESRELLIVRFRTEFRWSAKPWAALRCATIAVLADAEKPDKLGDGGVRIIE